MELAAKNSSSVSPACVPAGTAIVWLDRLPLLLALFTKLIVSGWSIALAVLVVLADVPLLSVTVSVTARSPPVA